MNKWKEHWQGPLIALLNGNELSLKTAVDIFGVTNFTKLIQELRDAHTKGSENAVHYKVGKTPIGLYDLLEEV